MSDTQYDVCGLGNALVDVLAHVDEDFLARENVAKGSMRLISEQEAESLYTQMPPSKQVSGGSAGNTIAGMAQLGSKTAFMGKVKDDVLGNVFRHDLTSLGVKFASPAAQNGTATGRSYILVTADGERTMNTFLGAAQDFSIADIDESIIKASKITYLEGYLWDPLPAKAAFAHAASIARAAGRDVALTLSDTFCVDRYRAEFLELMRSGKVTIIFANEHELKSLYETSDFKTALELLRADVPLGVVTMGAKGASVVQGSHTFVAHAPHIDNVVDLTGAGDLFAAGFLNAYVNGKSLQDSADAGIATASKVIQQIGARL